MEGTEDVDERGMNILTSVTGEFQVPGFEDALGSVSTSLIQQLMARTVV